MVSSSNVSVYFLKLISSVPAVAKQVSELLGFFYYSPIAAKKKVLVKSRLLMGQTSEGFYTEFEPVKHSNKYI